MSVQELSLDGRPTVLHLLIQTPFPCDANITAWKYHRLINLQPSYVTIWRNYSTNGLNNQFRLQYKGTLGNVGTGIITQFLDVPVQVEKGDFIGVVHSNRAASSQLSHCLSSTANCPFQQVSILNNFWAGGLSVGSSIYTHQISGTEEMAIPIEALVTEQGKKNIHTSIGQIVLDLSTFYARVPSYT